MTNNAIRKRLLDLAAEPYRVSGSFAFHFARGKLGGDPAFTFFLARGLLREATKNVLDLGCGQGLLAAWIEAARVLHQRGEWPNDWPAPPQHASVTGIELMENDVRRARAALSNRAEFICGDMCDTPFPIADVVVILDVLHYVDYTKQDDVLQRVRAALNPHGQLLLRVGDAAAGLSFKVTNWVDRAVLLARGHGFVPLYNRTVSEWRAQLNRLGFDVEAVPMSTGTPFANVLLVCTLEKTQTERNELQLDSPVLRKDSQLNISRDIAKARVL